MVLNADQVLWARFNQIAVFSEIFEIHKVSAYICTAHLYPFQFLLESNAELSQGSIHHEDGKENEDCFNSSINC